MFPRWAVCTQSGQLCVNVYSCSCTGRAAGAALCTLPPNSSKLRKKITRTSGKKQMLLQKNGYSTVCPRRLFHLYIVSKRYVQEILPHFI